MPNTKQRIRVLLSRDGDERTVLYAWRTRNDFYSTIPGKKGHRSYHADGRTHTKIEDWGEYNHYENIIFKGSPGNIQELTILQGIIFRNELSHHQDGSNFINQHGRDTDVVAKITAEQYLDNTFIAAAIGIAGSSEQLDKYIDAVKRNNILDIVSIKIAPEVNKTIFFAIIFSAKPEENYKMTSGFIHALAIKNGLTLPNPGNISIIEEGTASFTFRFTPELNTPFSPLHKNPPYLPIKLNPSMRKHTFNVTCSPFKHDWVHIGSISLRPVYKSFIEFQSMIAISTHTLCTQNVSIVNNSNSSNILAPIEAAIINFELGYLRGYTTQQFTCKEENYQLSIIRVSREKRTINGNKILDVQPINNFIWIAYYYFELIELGKIK